MQGAEDDGLFQVQELRQKVAICLCSVPPVLQVRMMGVAAMTLCVRVWTEESVMHVASEDCVDALLYILAHLSNPHLRLSSTAMQLSQQNLFNPLRLYRALCRPYEDVSHAEVALVQSPQLVCTLRPYQVRAVRWAMDVERYGIKGLTEKILELWREFYHPVEIGGHTFAANIYTGRVFDPPGPLPQLNVDLRGGILADEMGLGKTVETIALVLSNPSHLHTFAVDIPIYVDAKGIYYENVVRCFCGKDTRDVATVKCKCCGGLLHKVCLNNPTKDEIQSFVCPGCLFDTNTKIEVPSTVIVTPGAILSQWVDEIRKHAPSLSVMVYEGLRSAQADLVSNVERALLGKSPTKTPPTISPFVFARSQIILVSYQTLRKEISHEEFQTRSLRHVQRFPIIPCPLLRCSFHRVVLDEAQMVGGGGAVHVAAKMALKLEGAHRWAVSGTPFKRDTRDVQGLVKFLRLKPFDDKRIFSACLGEPHTSSHEESSRRLVRLLEMIMWRTAKKDARLGLAEPIQHLRVLDFTVSERFHYNRLYERAAEALQGDFRRHKSLVDLNLEFIRLRHACDHFQLGEQHLVFSDNGSRSSYMTVKKHLTLEDLQRSLIETERREYIDATRSWISNLHGLAGCMMLEQNFAAACMVYRNVLKHAEGDLEGKVDTLQKLHAAHNLLEAANKLKEKQQNLPAVIDLDGVAASVASMERRYVQEAREIVVRAFEQLDGLSKTCDHFEEREEPWWSLTLRSMMDVDVMELIDTSRENLAQRSSVMSMRLAEARSAAGMQMLIQGLIQELKYARLGVLKETREKLRCFLEREATDEEILRQKGCGRCHKNLLDELGKMPNGLCSFCEFETSVMLPYEAKVWLFDDNLCPGCNETVVLQQQINLEDDLQKDIAFNEEELEEMPVAELKRMLKDRGLVTGGKKSVLIMRLMEDQGVGSAKNNSLFCSDCHRWWHLRCVPKEMQKQQGPEWTCPACRGERVEMANEAGRIKHNSLVHQLLQLLAKHHKKLFGERDEVKEHLQLFRTIQEEFSSLREVFTNVRNLVGVFDELKQCRLRIRFPVPGEEIDESNFMFLVDRFSLPERRAELEMAVEQSDATRKMSLSKLRFMQNNGRQDSAQCPICLEDMSNDMVLLPCGHLCDYRCHQAWVARADKPNCSVCRAMAPEAKVKRIQNNKVEVSEKVEVLKKSSYLKELQELELAEPLIARRGGARSISGHWGTKLAAFVEDIKECFRSPEPARIIVFSQFPDILPVVKNACVENDIQVLYGSSASALGKSIEQFKLRAPKEKNIVLLLPVHKGAEGLTLTEGNIVMILEPTFPYALEQQAVARIHRIGQTHHSTHVYRYVIKGTVEQRLCEIAKHEVEQLEGNTLSSATDLSVDMIQTLLIPPSEEFHPEHQEDGFDQDELWWHVKVMYRNSPMSRREVFERYFANRDEDRGTTLLFGVEVPTNVAKIISELKPI